MQETFELRNKLELKEKSIYSQQQEFEAYQKQVSKRNETDEEELRNQFKKDFNLLKKEKDTVLNDLEQVCIFFLLYLQFALLVPISKSCSQTNQKSVKMLLFGQKNMKVNLWYVWRFIDDLQVKHMHCIN